MKKTPSFLLNVAIPLAIAIVVFTLLVFCTGCKKLPKPLDLGTISGRWAQVADTSNHFYIDSASTTTAVLRYPTRLSAPLGTYTRHLYALSISGRSISLTASILPGKYLLYQVSGKWRGVVYHQQPDGSMLPIDIMQLDNNRHQSAPDVVTPL